MKILAIALALTMLISAVAFAGMNADHKIALHIQAHGVTTGCTAKTNFPVIAGCEEIVTTLADADVDAFPVFFDLVGTRAFQIGLTWPGISSAAYTVCAGDLAIGNIVWPGDGVAQSYYDCVYDPIVILGFCWIYDFGMICPVPNPATNLLGTADCNFVEDEPMCIFCAGIGGYTGDDPCEPTATDASTWGNIKSMFK